MRIRALLVISFAIAGLALLVGRRVVPTPVRAETDSRLAPDFNGDTLSDLAIGIPSKDISDDRWDEGTVSLL